MRVIRFFQKLFRCHRIQALHITFVLITGNFERELDLRDSDHREVFGEQEEACKEQSEGTQVKS